MGPLYLGSNESFTDYQLLKWLRSGRRVKNIESDQTVEVAMSDYNEILDYGPQVVSVVRDLLSRVVDLEPGSNLVRRIYKSSLTDEVLSTKVLIKIGPLVTVKVLT